MKKVSIELIVMKDKKSKRDGLEIDLKPQELTNRLNVFTSGTLID